MSKPPAFQFYAGDWLASTATLSLQAKGAYIGCLSWSWVNGPLPESEETRARLIGVSRTQARRIWDEISPFWTKGPDGWFNGRLERMRQERAEYRASQAAKGRRGGEATAQHRQAGATAPAAAPAVARPQPEPSSSSSSSEDQELDQEQRAARAADSDRSESEGQDLNSEDENLDPTRTVPRKKNIALLTKIAIELRSQYPDDDGPEWKEKIRDAAARAKIPYDLATVTLAMNRAEHARKA